MPPGADGMISLRGGRPSSCAITAGMTWAPEGLNLRCQGWGSLVAPVSVLLPCAPADPHRSWQLSCCVTGDRLQPGPLHFLPLSLQTSLSTW